MRTKLILAIAAFGLLTQGCAALAQMQADAQARQAAQLAQQHLAENLANLTDHPKAVIIAGENVAHARGFTCQEEAQAAGADGNGTRCHCERHKATELGSAITQNVVGNILGADRGQIVKDHVVAANILVRRQWAADGMGDGGRYTYEIRGREYDITQNDQEANSVAFDSSRLDGWYKDLDAALAKR